jgi:hypothetical protein
MSTKQEMPMLRCRHHLINVATDSAGTEPPRFFALIANRLDCVEERKI